MSALVTGLNTDLVRQKLGLLVHSFNTILYEPDTQMLENMKSHNLAGDDPERYKYWEWPHGVGLFGLWKLYEKGREKAYLQSLENYYATRLDSGLPARNVNTTAPMFALSFLAEYTGKRYYMDACIKWAQWVKNEMTRTEEGGLQHVVSEQPNTGELWDDTLFMTVLFLANMGRILGREDYLDEAVYQFLVHAKYLVDRHTGLWYHGFTFQGRHNFVKALWARGNCWISIAIPVFLEIVNTSAPVKRYLQEILAQQAAALKTLQDPSGMWHTLLDDPDSYLETSATSGFGYGILKSVHDGLLDESFLPVAEAAIGATIRNINTEGIVEQVSYGTPMGRENRDFYKNIPIRPMPYGQSLALLALMETLE
jgi:unsaturated rhamnogalacturonyl hydrolase